MQEARDSGHGVESVVRSLPSWAEGPTTQLPKWGSKMMRSASILLLLLAAACAAPSHGVPIARSSGAAAYEYRGTVWSPSHAMEDAAAEVEEKAARDCPSGHSVIRLDTMELPLPTGWLYMDYDALVQCNA